MPMAPDRDDRSRSFLAPVLLVLLGLVLSALLAEGAARLAFRRSVADLSFQESDVYYYIDPTGARRHLPNSVGWERKWNDDGRVEVRINALGFRGPEIAEEKPEGRFRILFLGDSIVFGSRVPEEETFTSRIGRALAKSSGGRIEVANAAVQAIGVADIDAIYRENGLRIEPDLVVLGLYLNDARPTLGFPDEVVYDDPLIRWLDHNEVLRRSYVFGLVYQAWRQRLVRRELLDSEAASRRFQWAEPYDAGEWIDDPAAFAELVELARFDWGDAWNEASRAVVYDRVREMRETASEHGAAFAVLGMPLQGQVLATFDAPILDEPQRALRDFCRAEHLACLDLLPILRAVLRRRQEPIFFDQCHYTPYGNAVVAAAVLRFFRKQGLLASVPAG